MHAACRTESSGGVDSGGDPSRIAFSENRFMQILRAPNYSCSTRIRTLTVICFVRGLSACWAPIIDLGGIELYRQFGKFKSRPPISRVLLRDNHQMEHTWLKTYKVNMVTITKSNQLIVNQIQLIKTNQRVVELHPNIVVIVVSITLVHKNQTKHKLSWIIQRTEVQAEPVVIREVTFQRVVEALHQLLTRMLFHLKYMNNNKLYLNILIKKEDT